MAAVVAKSVRPKKRAPEIPPAPAARPTKHDAALQEAFLAAFCECGTITHAARAVKMSRTTHLN